MLAILVGVLCNDSGRIGGNGGSGGNTDVCAVGGEDDTDAGGEVGVKGFASSTRYLRMFSIALRAYDLDAAWTSENFSALKLCSSMKSSMS